MSRPATLPLVESLLDPPLPDSGIAWLDAARRNDRQAFAVTGLPDSKVEAWKYTALRALSQRRFAHGDAGAHTRTIDPATLALPGIEGPRLVFVNGAFRGDLSALHALPDGLTVEPLSKVLQRDAETLRADWSRFAAAGAPDAGDAFARINAASATDGVVLRVADNAIIDLPLQLVFAGVDGEAELAWHARNLIEIGAGASLTLIEQHVGNGALQQLATLVNEIDVYADAQLRHITLQEASPGANLIRHSRLRLHARSETSVFVVELGGALVRHELKIELAGDEAQVETRGVFMPHGRQHIDTQLSIRHQALNTRSRSNWRGVANDRARGVFRGAITVARGADGSDASLNNKNLLLSAGAEIDTKPELEIYADEVLAAHGATVGQLDERALFYLRSRGIPLADARALLTAAFCRAVLDDLPNPALREHLSALLIAQLPNA